MKNLLNHYQKELKDHWNLFKDKKTSKKEIPNILTLSRLLAPFIIVPLALNNKPILSLIFAIIFALTDLIDGYYARKYNAVSTFGKEIDPICDKIFVGGLLIPLILNYQKLIINIIIEIMIALIILYYRGQKRDTSVNFFGKIKTALLYILISYSFLTIFLKINNHIFNILFILCLTFQSLALLFYILEYSSNHTEKHVAAYKILKPLIIGLFKLYYNPKIIGKQNIPKKGAILVCGNHKNVHDQFLVISATNRMLHYMAKKEYFESKMAWFFEMVGCIPVNRQIKDENAKSKAIEILESEEALGIFPEGTRNKTEAMLLPFKFGAVSMAQKTKAKIVPFGISGDYKFRSKNLKVIIGKPYEVGDKDLEIANNELTEIVKDLILKGNKYERK